MKIEILGTGCPKCKKLTEQVEEAVKELGISAEIVKVTDIQDIINYGVMMTPALVIDGEVKSAGSVPSPEEIIKLLKE
ncbi:MAG: TM0996/MTH895 family glutaredoxin-like protein [Candidatus Omnitrophica bacterium]|nr:TM0996/MTH895 family glutaredoxin-like protein [Candidatus Omnitrophota bacterium]MBU1047764.1 TM0996/MTH895 family glutaredoxin-like protein [Candidatus Omnitrophota bacterium]MBU1631067.1 TM0996/MTH895 family glutaredoxin-like protein [Candidatus Omnitrophota bacterium]MBU1767670.1 TM0996/MTH895 family glutaredoxin-like protein [Candidatus Omnitrophota bacterium]MBU1889335.1 TM0996/MTH895 family glutaredoxin-like protein [Candidatus Omnitrophota bacterium]